MAKQDKKRNAKAAPGPEVEQINPEVLKARAAAMNQARLRSIARAQNAARIQMAKRMQAEMRRQQSMMSSGNADGAEDPADIEVHRYNSAMQAGENSSDVTPAEEMAAPIQSGENVSAPEMNASEVEAEQPQRDPDELEYAIRIKDLYKSYGKKQVLKGLNLDVYPGEMFGFLGKNGAGKSTTIDCMIGAKRFNSGSITVGGYDIATEPLDVKYSYGYVASEPTCYEVMTGYDYLEFVASIYRLTETEFAGNYKYLCKRLQLNEEELSHHISGYSHGMKQKLCLIASLMHNPNIWILDEPTVGLDIMAQEELKKMMREYANHGKTVFVTSHNIEMVSAICDRVAIVNNGVVEGIYDLNKDPQKRNELASIFIATYGG